MIVGCGVEVDRVANPGKRPEFDTEVIEPESSILAAADVVLAIAVATAGRGWLWFPS